MKITSYDLGNNIKKFILKKNDNFEVHVLNLGCIIERIIYNSQDMVLTYSDYNLYYNNGSYMGAIVGRTSGRIENSKYILNSKKYKLEVSEKDRNTNLHGGVNGYSNKIFNSRIENNKLILEYFDENKIYDSKVKVKVIYYLDENTNTLNVECIADSDKESYINMTNHTYFNLGNLDNDVLNHELIINADNYWLLKENMTPLKKEKVEGTIFDFRNSKKIGKDLGTKNSQFDITYYFDHPFELNHKNNYDVILKNPENNIIMKLKTNQNYVIMYAGNFLHQVARIDKNKENKRHLGVALETQNLPNGINLGKDYYEVTGPNKTYINKFSYTFEGGK